jgi:hypothetical protein
VVRNPEHTRTVVVPSASQRREPRIDRLPGRRARSRGSPCLAAGSGGQVEPRVTQGPRGRCQHPRDLFISTRPLPASNRRATSIGDFTPAEPARPLQIHAVRHQPHYRTMRPRRRGCRTGRRRPCRPGQHPLHRLQGSSERPWPGPGHHRPPPGGAALGRQAGADPGPRHLDDRHRLS